MSAIAQVSHDVVKCRGSLPCKLTRDFNKLSDVRQALGPIFLSHHDNVVVGLTDDILENLSGRGRVHNPIVGGPKEICDRLEQWWAEPACDGFVIAATHVPGAYEDFVRFVVPELQRRRLFRNEYGGTTLRDHLQLPVPAIGAWRRTPAPETM